MQRLSDRRWAWMAVVVGALLLLPGCTMPPWADRSWADDDDAVDDDTGDDDTSGDDDVADDDATDDDSGDDDSGDDDSGDDDSSDDDTSDDDDTMTTVTDIQQGNVPDGTTVTLQSVTVTTPVTEPFSNCESRGFWVQEPGGAPYSGIFVTFSNLNFPSFTVTPGDIVSLMGTYQEFYDLSQIVLADPADFSVLSAGSQLPPTALGEAGLVPDWEPYEGMLVTIDNPLVTGTVGDVGWGMFEVDGCLLVGSMFFENWDCGGQDLTPDPPMSQAMVSITGALHYIYTDYALEPIDANSFVGWTP